MKPRATGPLAGAIDRLLRGLGIATEVARIEAIDAWPAVAVAAFGPDGASTRAIRTDGTTLVVVVPTSAWASELRLRERDLIDRLRRASPRSGIERIRPVPAERATAP